MNALLDPLITSPPFGELLDGMGRRAWQGSATVPEPARGYALGALAEGLARSGRRLLVVCPTSTAALRLAGDMGALLGEGAVEVFPAWETLPFEHVSPSVETMGMRSRALWRARSGDEGLKVLVAPVRAAIQRAAPGLGAAEPLRLEAGGELDTDEALELLVGWGYERTYQVEARGEVALRGHILDIWPAAGAEPVRVELWGDEIETVRFFSVADQRSRGEAATAVLAFPAREVRPVEAVRRRAEEILSRSNWNRSVFEKVAEGMIFSGIESWLPWLVPDAVPMTSLLPDSFGVVVADPKAALDRAEALLAEERALAEALAGTWGWVESPELLDPGDSGAGSDGGTSAAPPGAAGVPTDAPTLFADPEELLAGSSRPLLRMVPAPEGPETVTLGLRAWERGAAGDRLVAEAMRLVAGGWQVVVSADDEAGAERLQASLAADGVEARPAGELSEAASEPLHPGVTLSRSAYAAGFLFGDGKLALLTQADLRGRAGIRAAGPRAPGADRHAAVEAFFADLEPGDHVVHYQHGIGRFAGMTTQRMGGVEREYLLVEYAADDKLYVPADQLDAIKKYSGGEKPRLSRLGGADWAKTSRKARMEAARVADELVRLYQDRLTVQGHAFGPDTPWQTEMEAAFPYALTADQARAIEEVKSDMEAPTPMDRLVCGDVGYGKTEVAVRAAFKAIQDGKQVAMLVPTTILAQQHFATFSERYEPYPAQVAMLSRFLTPAEEREAIAGIASGQVDVAIGTHRLISGDVSFARLGLLIVDEEQRFGVNHKEKIKQLRRSVDVLTLSATPIPRTLEMALTGIRDLSVIDTPPAERLPVLTYVGEYDESAVAAAIRREMLRDGQVFYVHNRVRSIDRALGHVRELAPGAKSVAAHGRMNEAQLERVMVDFVAGDIDVLVSTTIVESGLDIPRVNTLVVERADLLGLSQLYQLRGRVGRGRERAYAYLFYPARRALSEEAYERLKTIGEHTDLGSGFAIAMRDLEIRGAGNVLGEAQSGHIAAVGFDLYCQMVAEAVAARRGRPVERQVPVKIELPVDAHLPQEYVAAESLRLEAYRKLGGVTTPEGVASMRAEWEDRFGPLPPAAEALLDVGAVRAECVRLGATEVVWARGRVRLGPVDLKASQEVRLERHAPGAIFKADQQELVLPLDGGRDAARRLVALLQKVVPVGSELRPTG